MGNCVMNKSIRRTVVAATASLLLSALGVYAYLNDTGIHKPAAYYSFVPPNVGGSYADQVYSTSITRITNAPATLNAAVGSGNLTFITNEYSTMTPFNKDNTRLILQHESYFALYDGNGAFLRNLPFAVHASSEPRWSRSDAATLYFVNNNALRKVNVETGALTTLHTFSEYSSISGKGESDICFDGNHFVFAG